MVTVTDTSIETPQKAPFMEVKFECPSRLFVENDDDDDDNDEIPDRFCHIRDSERKVPDPFYLTVSALGGRSGSESSRRDTIIR